MNKTLTRALLATALSMIFYTGSAQKIISDYDGKADWSNYKTYAWVAPGDSVFNRVRTDKVFADAILYAANAELKKKGMRIDTLQPQSVFVFDTKVEDITVYKQGATLSVGVAVAGPGYYVGGSAPVAGGKITASTIQGGQLVYAMYDAKNKRLIWSGRVETEFKLSDDIQKMIFDYTKKIFKKFPIKNK